MNETVKIEVYISTNKVGSECRDSFEIDREEWAEMSDDQKEEVCRDAAFDMMEWGFREA